MVLVILLSVVEAFTAVSSIPAKDPLSANKLLPAPIPRTGQTKSYSIRDDGALKMGVSWPYPRFTDQGDGKIKDNLKGLMWLKNANYFGSTD
jgi:hypothetical protein